jgi:hypothetical protein
MMPSIALGAAATMIGHVSSARWPPADENGVLHLLGVH